ncbi:MAG: tetratricopeptide repeat protein [Desulfocapsaceae bacterium]|jgi:tetratricopeptide (TPR) repeat protein|nr:tetratricopeptide repeat protein [Desulfocapsaceae bacterium]
MKHKTQKIFLCRTLAILVLFFTLISCAPRAGETSLSAAKSESRDTSCSYFYFLWGTHEEYYRRHEEALDAYQKALVCDPEASHIENKLPILYLKMDLPEKAIDLLLAGLEKTPKDSSRRSLLANIYIRQKKDSEAIEQYRIILSDEPDNSQALLRMGILLTQKGELKNADSYFRKLLTLDQESYFSRLYLARIADRLGNSADAEKQYRAALELNYSAELIYEFSEFLLKHKHYEKTIEIMRALLDQDDTDERARFTIVQALLALDREEEAVAELSLAREVSSTPEKISLLLSRLYLRNENNAKAIENLLSVLETKENPEARYLLAVLYMDAQQWTEALEMLAAISPNDEEFEDGVVLQTRIYHQIGEIEKGLQLLQNYLENPEMQRELFFILASSLYQENNQSDSASETLADGIRAHPESEKLLFEYGLQLERTNRLEEAIAAMEKIVELNPDHPEALNFIGYSWADTDRNLEQALDYISRAMELKPDNGYIQDSLGWVHYKLGNLETARDELTGALELVPDDPHIYDHLGDVYRALNMPEKALDAYRSALEYFEDQDKKAAVKKKIETLTAP